MTPTPRGLKVIIVVEIFQFLTMLVVGARLALRIYPIHNFGADDWLILLSLVSSVNECLFGVCF
jgi:hypothetical protein